MHNVNWYMIYDILTLVETNEYYIIMVNISLFPKKKSKYIHDQHFEQHSRVSENTEGSATE